MLLTIIMLVVLIGGLAGISVVLSLFGLSATYTVGIPAAIMAVEILGYLFAVMVSLWSAKQRKQVSLHVHGWMYQALASWYQFNCGGDWERQLEKYKYRNLCFIGTVTWLCLHWMIFVYWPVYIVVYWGVYRLILYPIIGVFVWRWILKGVLWQCIIYPIINAAPWIKWVFTATNEKWPHPTWMLAILAMLIVPVFIFKLWAIAWWALIIAAVLFIAFAVLNLVVDNEFQAAWVEFWQDCWSGLVRHDMFDEVGYKALVLLFWTVLSLLAATPFILWPVITSYVVLTVLAYACLITGLYQLLNGRFASANMYFVGAVISSFLMFWAMHPSARPTDNVNWWELVMALPTILGVVIIAITLIVLAIKMVGSWLMPHKATIEAHHTGTVAIKLTRTGGGVAKRRVVAKEQPPLAKPKKLKKRESAWMLVVETIGLNLLVVAFVVGMVAVVIQMFTGLAGVPLVARFIPFMLMLVCGVFVWVLTHEAVERFWVQWIFRPLARATWGGLRPIWLILWWFIRVPLFGLLLLIIRFTAVIGERMKDFKQGICPLVEIKVVSDSNK